MWLVLQQSKPEDFVIATGEQHSVREFVGAAAQELGIAIRWQGQGVAEKGYDELGRCVVAVDSRYFRPTEVETLLGDASTRTGGLATVSRRGGTRSRSRP
jgi:GDPmannose 4,6-dehydratase